MTPSPRSGSCRDPAAHRLHAKQILKLCKDSPIGLAHIPAGEELGMIAFNQVIPLIPVVVPREEYCPGVYAVCEEQVGAERLVIRVELENIPDEQSIGEL